MRLIVEPAEQLADATPMLRVTGTEPGATVSISITTVDAAGHRWEGTSAFRSDEAGEVSVDADAPVSGGYEGVDPTGPWWSMAFADEHIAPTTFTMPAEALELVVTATCADDRDEVTVTRRWQPDDADRTTLAGDGFIARCTLHPGSAPRPMVVIVPGSTGSTPMVPVAGLLAAHGYHTAILSVMQEDELPPSLREIPLEALHRGLAAIGALDQVDDHRLAVVSYSVGTIVTLAGLACPSAPAVRGVAAIAPSSVVWQALSEGGPPPKASSVTLDGEPLAWLATHGEKVLPEVVRHATIDRLYHRHPRPRALHLRKTYEPGLGDVDAVAAATIEVERIDAPLLLISGTDDQMWPSSEMAAAIGSRRAANGRAGDHHLDLADAGHFIRPPLTPTTVAWNDDLVSGGTPEGSAHASQHAWAALLGALSTWLGGDPTA